MEEKKDPNDILLSRTFTEILIEQYRAHTCLYSESTNLKREMAYRSIRKGLKRQGYDIEEKLWKDRFCSLRKTRNKIMERKALGAEIIPRNFHYYDQLDFLPPPPRIKRIHFEVVGNSQSGVRQQAPENEMEHETTFEEKDKRDELITSSEIIPSVILLTSRAKNSDAIETTTKADEFSVPKQMTESATTSKGSTDESITNSDTSVIQSSSMDKKREHGVEHCSGKEEKPNEDKINKFLNCLRCQRQIRAVKWKLKDHYKRMHTSLYAFCSEEVSRTLNEFRNKSSEEKSKTTRDGYLSCLSCNKQIYAKGRFANLRRHYRTVHKNIDPERAQQEISLAIENRPKVFKETKSLNFKVCSYCKGTFRYSTLYKSHLRLTHNKFCPSVERTSAVKAAMLRARHSLKFSNSWTTSHMAIRVKPKESELISVFHEDTVVDVDTLIDNYLRWSTSLAGKTPLMNGALRQKVLKKEKLSFIESRGAKYMYCKSVREKQRRVLEFYFGKRNFQIKELQGIDQIVYDDDVQLEFMKSKRANGLISYRYLGFIFKATTFLLSFVIDHCKGDSLRTELTSVFSTFKQSSRNIQSHCNSEDRKIYNSPDNNDHLIDMKEIAKLFASEQTKNVIKQALNHQSLDENIWDSDRILFLKSLTAILLAFKTAKRCVVLRWMTLKHIFDAEPVMENDINFMKVRVTPPEGLSLKTVIESDVLIPLDVYDLTKALAEILARTCDPNITCLQSRKHNKNCEDMHYFFHSAFEIASIPIPKNLNSNNVRRTCVFSLTRDSFVTKSELSSLAEDMEHSTDMQEKTYLIKRIQMPIVRYHHSLSWQSVIIHPANLLNILLHIEHWDKPLNQESELYRELKRRMLRHPSDTILSSYPDIIPLDQNDN